MRAWKLTMDTSSIGELFILLFKSRRTLCVTLQNMMRLSFCKHFVNIRNDYVVTGHARNSITAAIKSNTMLLSSFMWLWMSNKCVKFYVKIPGGCWENGKKTLGDTFLPHTVYFWFLSPVFVYKFITFLKFFPPVMTPISLFRRFLALSVFILSPPPYIPYSYCRLFVDLMYRIWRFFFSAGAKTVASVIE